jgi:hypothetical protein
LPLVPSKFPSGVGWPRIPSKYILSESTEGSSGDVKSWRAKPSLKRDSWDYVQTGEPRAGRSGPPYIRGNWSIPSATRPGVRCRAALALAILALTVLSDPSARPTAEPDWRLGTKLVGPLRRSGRFARPQCERLQSAGSDRMGEPARKCQPIGHSVQRSFQARFVGRTLKRGPTPGASLTLMPIDDSSQFWQVPC